MINFVAGVKMPEKAAGAAWWFIFRKDDLLILAKEDETEKQPDAEMLPQEIIPVFEDPSEAGLTVLRTQYLGSLGGRQCFSAEVSPLQSSPEGMAFRGLRSLLSVVDSEIFAIAGRAFQVMDWDRNHQFCGRCGTPTKEKDGERAKECPNCGLINYPRISPAVIVAVIRDGKILLAHSGRFRTKMFSVLAGFVETGETFEECVKREIKEEVNIEVKDIRYFGSQPWPFPNSIMIGFTAEYSSGEIKADGEEILEAGWFSPDDMPPIPGKWSIARKLIDWFIDSGKK